MGDEAEVQAAGGVETHFPDLAALEHDGRGFDLCDADSELILQLGIVHQFPEKSPEFLFEFVGRPAIGSGRRGALFEIAGCRGGLVLAENAPKEGQAGAFFGVALTNGVLVEFDQRGFEVNQSSDGFDGLGFFQGSIEANLVPADDADGTSVFVEILLEDIGLGDATGGLQAGNERAELFALFFQFGDVCGELTDVP